MFGQAAVPGLGMRISCCAGRVSEISELNIEPNIKYKVKVEYL